MLHVTLTGHVTLTLTPTPTPEQVLPGPEAFDTAFVLLKFANGKEAAIDVCRKATYGYDQRAEVSLVCSSSSKYYVVVS